MRGDNGLFTLKGTEPRKLRSIMLTQFCWDKLQELAAKDGCSRSDLLEKWVTEDVSNLRDEVARLRAEKEELLARVAETPAQSHQVADATAAEKDVTINELSGRYLQLQGQMEVFKRSHEILKSQLAEAQSQRDAFDQELNTLHTKNGDLNLELALLREKLQQTADAHLSNPPQDDRIREELAKIIELANANTTGYTTKSFSRGLKKLKEIMTAE